MRVTMVLLAALAAGCATPNEIRETGPRRDVALATAAPGPLAKCLAGALDEHVPVWAHLVREDAERVSVISRNAETAVVVTDLRAAPGGGTRATIYTGPSAFMSQRLMDTIERELRRCDR